MRNVRNNMGSLTMPMFIVFALISIFLFIGLNKWMSLLLKNQMVVECLTMPDQNITTHTVNLPINTTYSCKNGYNADPADPSPTPRRPPKGRRLFVNNTNDSKLLIGVKISMPTPF